MRFILDEGADYDPVPFMAELGHDIVAVGRGYPRSLADTEILAIAVAEDRIVITNDTDLATSCFSVAARMPASSC